MFAHGGSGLQRAYGHVVRVHDDRTELELTLSEQHMNRRGVLHGGVMATVLDIVCGYACSRAVSPDASAAILTLSLTTHYLAPGTGGRITATGRVTGGGTRTLFAEGRITDDAGTLLATGSGVFKRVSGDGG